ncbi:MAG: class I SAM-dependent methyltransferase [Chitinophagaceae bacterium]|nr:MAG: class I SAM-dependent methyltransferase [Chitinophagaceae bacterium]
MSINENNMYTDGSYLSKNPSWHSEDSKWKAEEINKMIKRNKLAPVSVADAGCGAGQVLLHLSELNPGITELRGFDISPQAIEMARKSENPKVKFYQADIANEITGTFSLILVIDVIEHLNDYAAFLHRISTKAEQFIFHIPLDLSFRTIMKPHILLQQRNDVGHIHYFSKEQVEWIMKDAGFSITDRFYTLPEIDREKPASFKNWVKKILRKISFSLNKDMSAKLWGGYSIMILATKK